MFGFLTTQQLWGFTTFVDHVSDFVYVHLIWGLSISEMLLSKVEMEKIVAQSGQAIKHYHANNGKFVDNVFFDTINEKDQMLKWWGMGLY